MALYCSPGQVLSQLAFRFKKKSSQEKKRKIDFQDGHLDGHLWFLVGTILAIYDLHVILMLPTKFQVDWPFGSGEEAKKLIFNMATTAAIFDFQSKRL